MTQDGVTLYTNFLGVGYRYQDVHTHVLLMFKSKKDLLTVWNKVVKWWPDDEIKIRFVEGDNHYEFVLYGESRILENKWVFLKALKTSENYQRFKEEYDGAAYLGFALYKPETKDDSYHLEIFKYRKKVADVRFIKETEVEQDSIVLKSRQILRDSALGK